MSSCLTVTLMLTHKYLTKRIYRNVKRITLYTKTRWISLHTDCTFKISIWFSLPVLLWPRGARVTCVLQCQLWLVSPTSICLAWQGFVLFSMLVLRAVNARVSVWVTSYNQSWQVSFFFFCLLAVVCTFPELNKQSLSLFFPPGFSVNSCSGWTASSASSTSRAVETRGEKTGERHHHRRCHLQQGTRMSACGQCRTPHGSE